VLFALTSVSDPPAPLATKAHQGLSRLSRDFRNQAFALRNPATRKRLPRSGFVQISITPTDRCRFDCYRVERTSSLAGVTPAEVQRLFTAHFFVNCRLVVPVERLRRDPYHKGQFGIFVAPGDFPTTCCRKFNTPTRKAPSLGSREELVAFKIAAGGAGPSSLRAVTVNLPASFSGTHGRGP